MDNPAPNSAAIIERQEKDKQAVIEGLKEMPVIAVACKKAGIGRTTFYRWLKEDAHFVKQSEDAMYQGIEFINDMSESQLVTLIKEKKMPAIALWLKNNHKRYGAKLPSRTPTTMEHLNPNDPQYQKLQKVAMQYEEKLRETIIEEICGDAK